MSSKCQSYAAASDGLCDVIKFAITESTKEQMAAEQNRTCVTINDIHECEYSDIPDIRELSEYLDCNVHVINLVCNGRPTKLFKKPCLLKISLQIITDKTLWLKAFKDLREDPSTAVISSRRDCLHSR